MLNLEGIIDSRSICSNHVWEILRNLGLEASYIIFVQELSKILNLEGGHFDLRHLHLLIDVMTFDGTFTSLNRKGFKRFVVDPLCLCTFEEPSLVIFRAAVFCKSDRILGISSCLLLGQVFLVGTSSFSLFVALEKKTHFHARGLIKSP